MYIRPRRCLQHDRYADNDPPEGCEIPRSWAQKWLRNRVKPVPGTKMPEYNHDTDLQVGDYVGALVPADVEKEQQPVVIDVDKADGDIPAGLATGPNASWSSDQVAAWFRVRKFSAKTLAAFEGLDGEELMTLTKDDFVEAGVSLGKAVAVVKLIYPLGSAGQPISIE